MVSSLSYNELDELIEMAQQAREGKREEVRRSIMQEFEEKAAAIGLTTAQLLGQEQRAPEKGKRGRRAAEPQPGPKTESVVKFRSPQGETWSGRGRKPKWLTQAESEGQSAEDFRI